MKVLTICLMLTAFAGCRQTAIDTVPQAQGCQTVVHGFEAEDGARTAYGKVDTGSAGGETGEAGDYSDRKVAR